MNNLLNNCKNFLTEGENMKIKNYEQSTYVSVIFGFCDENNICAVNFNPDNDELIESMMENKEVILKLIKSFHINGNDTQKETILGFLKHVIVDKNNYVLINDENDILRFIYYVNEFKDFQKISYKKDFLNFNAHNYIKTYISKGKIRMLNMKNPELDKNNRYFIIEKGLYNEYKEITNKNYFFEVDINTSYIYSYQRRRTKQKLQETYLSDVLDFVKKYHTVGFDYDKAQENAEYYQYLIMTYFEYYKHSPESLLDFLENKITIVNDISSNSDESEPLHDTEYYLNLFK